MRISCLHCGHPYEVPEGTNLQGAACPNCGTLRTANFMQAQVLRFEPVEVPAYAKACERARAGDRDAALAALEEALRAGMDLEIVDSDPAMGTLRGDPRFGALVKRYRPV